MRISQCINRTNDQSKNERQTRPAAKGTATSLAAKKNGKRSAAKEQQRSTGKRSATKCNSIDQQGNDQQRNLTATMISHEMNVNDHKAQYISNYYTSTSTEHWL